MSTDLGPQTDGVGEGTLRTSLTSDVLLRPSTRTGEEEDVGTRTDGGSGPRVSCTSLPQVRKLSYSRRRKSLGPVTEDPEGRNRPPSLQVGQNRNPRRTGHTQTEPDSSVPVVVEFQCLQWTLTDPSPVGVGLTRRWGR